MSRSYRSSEPNLGFFSDEPKRPVERWDRDRFAKESLRFEERDRYGPRGRRDIEIDERFERRDSRGRTVEKDRFFEEDRRYRRPEFLDREELISPEIANRALAPYRRKSIVEKDFDPPPRRPARPQFIRRQSSLDTFDRRPRPRYGDHDRDDFRIPSNVPVPLPIRARSRSRRRHSPPRDRYREEDYEEIRYRDVGSDREDEYRDVTVRRARSRRRRTKSRTRSGRSSSSSSSSFTEVSPVRQPGKKGRTRMPKRLVHKSAVIELGYPFEEEDDFIIIRRALEKEHIDEIIKISESYKEKTKTYRYEEKTESPPPPPPPPVPLPVHPPHHMVAESHYSASVRSPSPPRREVLEERIEESNHIGGPLTIVAPERRVRSELEIRDEIRALEAERKALRLEREADRIREYREGDFEIIEHERPRNVIRVEKDRKVRRVPDPKALAFAMSTLT